MKLIARYFTLLIIGFCMELCPQVQADVRLPKILSSGLVLQQDTPNEIWGSADAGENISLRLDGQEISSVKAIGR